MMLSWRQYARCQAGCHYLFQHLFWVDGPIRGAHEALVEVSILGLKHENVPAKYGNYSIILR